YGLNERRACGLVGIARWINRYQSCRDSQVDLRSSGLICSRGCLPDSSEPSRIPICALGSSARDNEVDGSAAECSFGLYISDEIEVRQQGGFVVYCATMPFTPGSDYDLFISYSTVNNRGKWVSSLHDVLTAELEELLGPPFSKTSVYFD